MNDIKKNISLVNIGILSLIIKVLVFGGDIASAIIFTALSSIYAFKMFLDKRQDDRFDKIQQDLNTIKEKDITELRSAVTALKINNGVKRLNEQQAEPNQTIKRFF